MYQLIMVCSIFNVALSMAPLVDNSTKTEDLSEIYRKRFENSTSCEELLANYTFDPLSVIDVDWKTFYFWNAAKEPLHMFRFSFPYPVLLDRFRTELNLTPPVDWNRTVLFMETSNDLSALFISTNVSGRFRIVTNFDFYHDLPYTEMALKLVKPFYLILQQCEFRFGYALAPFDNMPDEKHIEDAISVLGIRSEFNETYLIEEQFQSQFSMQDDPKRDDDYDDYQYLDDDEL